MKNKTILNITVFLIIISVSIAGCKAEQKDTSETIEEVVDTGALVVESSPESAQVYIGEEYRGDTPLELYNTPVGTYKLLIKKDGYVDFEKTVTIKVGKIEEIDAILTPITVEPDAEEKKAEEPTEKQMTGITATKPNRINLSSFAMYFDFDKMQFTELRTEGSDLFSRKYDTYVYFTALTPTKINVVNKPIKEVKKEDCIFSDTTVTPLFSAQTLCIKTGNGIVVALGGVWQTMPNELELAQFS